MSLQDDNTDVVKRLCEAVNKRELHRMGEFFAEGFKDNNPAWSVSTVAELTQIIDSALKSLNQFITQDVIFAVDDKVVVVLTLKGHHIGPFLGIPPTNKEVIWTSIEIFRLDQGKIVERWVQADTAGLMRQLGVQLPG